MQARKNVHYILLLYTAVNMKTYITCSYWLLCYILYLCDNLFFILLFTFKKVCPSTFCHRVSGRFRDYELRHCPFTLISISTWLLFCLDLVAFVWNFSKIPFIFVMKNYVLSIEWVLFSTNFSELCLKNKKQKYYLATLNIAQWIKHCLVVKRNQYMKNISKIMCLLRKK